KEQLFHVMSLVERFERGDGCLFVWTKAFQEVGGLFADLGVFKPAALDVDVMSLVVKDELPLWPLLIKGGGIKRIDRIDFVGLAKDLVEGDHRRGHPGRSLQKGASGEPELFRVAVRKVAEPVLPFLLFSRLRGWYELFVRAHPRRNRRLNVR